MTFVSGLITFIGGAAIIWYYLCVGYLGFVHPEPLPNDQFRQFMGLSISTISGTLATYVGMILGVQTAASEPKTNRLAAVVQTRTAPITLLQAIAAVAYVASLIVALFAWWWNFEHPDPVIVALGKSFLGLIGGALAVILNVNVRNPG
jgi:hypothetical protein